MMRRLMKRGTQTVGARSLLASILVAVAIAAPAIAQTPASHRPLPAQILSNSPSIRPYGKGRHTIWGVRVYDATLWIVGPRWSDSEPHALDIEPGRAVPGDTLVKNAISEMRNLKVGDESKLRVWQAELTKIVPNLAQGDQIVIFCADNNRTIGYLNESRIGEVDDPTFCPAVMSVWLHPQTKHQSMRKSLLGQ